MITIIISNICIEVIIITELTPNIAKASSYNNL